MKKRASYRFGIAWIALNDETGETDVEQVKGFISVLLLADLFDVPPEKVAADVLKFRADSRHQL
jgi:hypothetical protein